MQSSFRPPDFRRLLALPTLLGLVLVASGCASTSAPEGWLPTSPEAQKEAFGAWAEVSTTYGRVLQGELVAVGPERVLVLRADTLHIVVRREIERLRVFAYKASRTLIAGWGLLGVLSAPLAHGYYSTFSVPIWLGTAILAGSRQSYAPVYTFPSATWASLRRFARFPQGLPGAVDMSQLRHKPMPD